jgi:hypothetical protein
MLCFLPRADLLQRRRVTGVAKQPRPDRREESARIRATNAHQAPAGGRAMAEHRTAEKMPTPAVPRLRRRLRVLFKLSRTLARWSGARLRINAPSIVRVDKDEHAPILKVVSALVYTAASYRCDCPHGEALRFRLLPAHPVRR